VWLKVSGSTGYNAFALYEDAEAFYENTPGADKPLVLVLQYEYIAEDVSGNLKHIKKKRLAEWLPEWLEGNQGTVKQIPKFLINHQR
jgi:hypothetical protein